MADINIDNVSHPLVRYRNHLEFHGYQVEEEDDNLLNCSHPRKYDLDVFNCPGVGVSITIFCFVKTEVKRTYLLEYVNELNLKFRFMKASILLENLLTIKTFFHGEYDRTRFSILLENIEDDISVLYENELTEEYLVYLK